MTSDEFRRPDLSDTLCPYSSSDDESGNQSFAEDLLVDESCEGGTPAEHHSNEEDPHLGSESNSKTAETPVARPHVQESCSDCAARDMEINMLREERDCAREQVFHLTQQVNQFRLSASSIENNNRRSKFLTGVSYSIFLKTFLFLNAIIPQRSHKDGLSAIDQFFITLVKLRLDLTFEFLSYQTGFSESTLRGYF